jgi:CheY-like chemotaxis protein
MHPIRILLAEDNPVNQKVAELMFKRLGYGIEIVSNGQEAIEAIQQHAYDIVVMDSQMPVMDGVTAARWIRDSLPPEEQPMILVMSASMIADSKAEWKGVNVDGFIEKPVRVDQMRDKMDDALSRLEAMRHAAI